MNIIRGSGGGSSNKAAREANTQAANVLTGSQFVRADGTVGEGTMPNNSLNGTEYVNKLKTLKQDESYVIPKGYYDGSHTYIQGGDVTELWRNPATNKSFAAQNIDLSEAATNFQKLRIVYKMANTDTDNENFWNEFNLQVGGTSIASMYDDTRKKNGKDHENRLRFGILFIGTTYMYGRQMYFVTTNNVADYSKLYSGNCFQLNHNINNSSLLIPIAIYGVNRVS